MADEANVNGLSEPLDGDHDFGDGEKYRSPQARDAGIGNANEARPPVDTTNPNLHTGTHGQEPHGDRVLVSNTQPDDSSSVDSLTSEEAESAEHRGVESEAI